MYGDNGLRMTILALAASHRIGRREYHGLQAREPHVQRSHANDILSQKK